jgi:hypothetical protein
MWGPFVGATSSPAPAAPRPFGIMNSAERNIEFLPHFVEWQRKRRPPADQDVIVAGTHHPG